MKARPSCTGSMDHFGIYRAPRRHIRGGQRSTAAGSKGPVIANQLRHVEAETLLFGMEPVPFDDTATWHRARAHIWTILLAAEQR